MTTTFVQPTESIVEWLQASAPTFSFAQSLLQSIERYGSLTPRQFETAQRLATQAAQTKAPAPEVSIEAVEVAFNNAKATGLKFPKLRLGAFVFSPAPAHGKNAGAVYVKKEGEYLGKIMNGKLFAYTDEDTKAEIVKVAQAPHDSAVAYGKMFGACAVCNRTLTDSESVARGIGPICAEKFGW
jgi:hypothetical protein